MFNVVCSLYPFLSLWSPSSLPLFILVLLSLLLFLPSFHLFPLSPLPLSVSSFSSYFPFSVNVYLSLSCVTCSCWCYLINALTLPILRRFYLLLSNIMDLCTSILLLPSLLLSSTTEKNLCFYGNVYTQLSTWRSTVYIAVCVSA